MNQYEPSGRPLELPRGSGAFAPAMQPQYHGRAPEFGYFPNEFPDEDRFDPLKLLWYVVHYRWLIGALLTVGLVAGVMATYLQTPLYRSATNIEILTTGAKVIQDLEVVSQTSDLRAFETARQKILSRELARRVVYELDLPNSKEFLAPTPRFSLMNLVNRATGSSTVAELEGLSAESREAWAVDVVMGGLNVSLIPNTSILAVSYSHASPKFAALVANQVARSHIDQTVDKRSETSDLARQFIEEQVRETKAKLQDSEKALVEYAKATGITITGNDASLISENIRELNTARATAIQERLAAERYRDQVRQGDASTLPEVFESKSIQETKRKIAELKATNQEKLQTLKPGFPEMQGLSAQIVELEKQIDEEVRSIANSVEIRYVQALEKEQSVQRELTKLEQQQSEFQDKNIQYTILKREVDSNRSQYENLIGKLNEVGVGAELKTANVLIVDAAIPAGAPYSPQLPRTVLLSLVIFALIAIAIIYLLELMNNTFSVPDQVETELKLPVLGIIPATPDSELLEAFKDNKSALSEAYRSLRTSLQFTGTEGSMRTVLVTSSEPSEGKSTTVYKLAQDFAALGRKVLVIDADLRKPKMHRFFDLTNTIGLSNLLSNVVRQGEVGQIFHKTPVANLSLLPAGTIPPNPVDLLMSQRMALLLHYCAKRYDLVIIDSPPVMGLSDSPILSRQADATLLIVSSKKVTRKAVKSALNRLKAAGGNVVGAALTKFEIDKLDYNYAYRYMNYNYYSYESLPNEIENHAEHSHRKSYPGGRIVRALSDMFGRFNGGRA